jgi:hypothetical protein
MQHWITKQPRIDGGLPGLFGVQLCSVDIPRRSLELLSYIGQYARVAATA